MDERVAVTADDIQFMLDAATTEPDRLYGFFPAHQKVSICLQLIKKGTFKSEDNLSTIL